MIARLIANRLRLFPVLVVAGALLFSMKADVFWELASIGEAQAQSAGGDGAKPEAGKPAQAAEEDAEQPAPRRKRNPRAAFSPSEVDVLQKLARRRAELDERQREMETRERLLAAAEEQLKKKIAELKKIEANVASMLKRQDEAEEQRMASLVKVYERMKPKQAARIFEELDMKVILQVARRMKEANVAQILAAMDPVKARDITARIASGDDTATPRRKTRPAGQDRDAAGNSGQLPGEDAGAGRG